MSQMVFDSITRSALWNVWKNKCFYCDKDLEWECLHIDHLLPESLKNKANEFKQIIFEYELDGNYGLNEFYNLVPSHSTCNQRKSGSR